MVFLEDNWLFFLLSLVAGIEGIAGVLISGGFESFWSSVTVSWLGVASVVFTTSLEFSFGYFSFRLESIEVNCSSEVKEMNTGLL